MPNAEPRKPAFVYKPCSISPQDISLAEQGNEIDMKPNTRHWVVMLDCYGNESRRRELVTSTKLAVPSIHFTDDWLPRGDLGMDHT